MNKMKLSVVGQGWGHELSGDLQGVVEVTSNHSVHDVHNDTSTVTMVVKGLQHKNVEPVEEPCSPQDDVRGWRGPVGFALVVPNGAHLCACCGKVIRAVKAESLRLSNREERDAARRKALIARWPTYGAEIGASTLFAHTKCLATRRDRVLAHMGSSSVVYDASMDFPKGLWLSTADLEDSAPRRRQESRVAYAVKNGKDKQEAWRIEIEKVQATEDAKVREAIRKEDSAGRLKPERGDGVVAYGSHWNIESLDKRAALLSDATQQRHLRLPVEELVFVSRPGLLVLDPSKAVYTFSESN